MSELVGSSVQVRGPLAEHQCGFRLALELQGYAPSTVVEHERLMANLSGWLEHEGLQAEALGVPLLERFLLRRRERRAKLVSLRALAPLLAYLRDRAVVPAVTGPAASSGLELVIEAYVGFLVKQRGVVPGTVRLYRRFARLFLAAVLGAHHEDLSADATGLVLGRLDARFVADFVLRECRQRSIASSRSLITALRSLLRFLHVAGHAPESLLAAVPAVAGWSAASLPRAVSPEVVAALLGSCDAEQPLGRRDLAMLLLLVRLGLRAHEVAALELDDVDWRAGELSIRGKGRRQERMPVPHEVGEALVGYVQFGRPPCATRSVFVSARVPRRPISASGVRSVVHRACLRAGLTPFAAHRLRHTAATTMLRSGAALQDVAQVLRHRDLATTALYAKVDWKSLATLTRPWPTVEA
jgi:integrase/recombinase XerD